MPNLAAIATPAAHLFGERQNQSLPRLAALYAAICLALLACAHPTPPTALPPDVATPTPTTQPTPTPAPASQSLAIDATPVAQNVPHEDVAFTQVTVGATHACGLREPAAPPCWGRDIYGGNCPHKWAAAPLFWGEDPNAHSILDAPAQTDFTQISAGLHFTCALRQDGTIACWGDNSAGQSPPPARLIHRNSRRAKPRLRHPPAPIRAPRAYMLGRPIPKRR